jgi:hypothetical protein
VAYLELWVESRSKGFVEFARDGVTQEKSNKTKPVGSFGRKFIVDRSPSFPCKTRLFRGFDKLVDTCVIRSDSFAQCQSSFHL